MVIRNGTPLRFIVASIISTAISSAAFAQTGLLPICPPGFIPQTPISLEVVTNPAAQIYIGGGLFSSLGVEQPCAQQNWFGPTGNDLSAPQSVQAFATPNVISISSLPTTVVFHVLPLALSGGIDLYMPECMPAASGSAKVCENGYPMFVYRMADNSGNFSGKWTTANASTNPYFQLKRLQDCPSPLQNLTNPGNGAPCPYELRFGLTPTGAPTLQRSMQVVMFNGGGGGGTETINGFTGYKETASFVTPLLFTAGGGVEIDIVTPNSSILSSKKSSVAALLKGSISPSSLPVLALEAASPPGSGNFTVVNSGSTDSAGNISFEINPQVNTDYRFKLLGQNLGATVTSDIVTILVARSISLKATKNNSQVSFSGKVAPAGGTVKLQRLVKKNWKTVKTGKLKKGAYLITVSLPSGTTEWRTQIAPTAQNTLSLSPVRKVKR